MIKQIIIGVIVSIAIHLYINQTKTEYYLKGFAECERQINEKDVDWFINHSELKRQNLLNFQKYTNTNQSENTNQIP